MEVPDTSFIDGALEQAHHVSLKPRKREDVSTNSREHTRRQIYHEIAEERSQRPEFDSQEFKRKWHEAEAKLLEKEKELAISQVEKALYMRAHEEAEERANGLAAKLSQLEQRNTLFEKAAVRREQKASQHDREVASKKEEVDCRAINTATTGMGLETDWTEPGLLEEEITSIKTQPEDEQSKHEVNKDGFSKTKDKPRDAYDDIRGYRGDIEDYKVKIKRFKKEVAAAKVKIDDWKPLADLLAKIRGRKHEIDKEHGQNGDAIRARSHVAHFGCPLEGAILDVKYAPWDGRYNAQFKPNYAFDARLVYVIGRSGRFRTILTYRGTMVFLITKDKFNTSAFEIAFQAIFKDSPVKLYANKGMFPGNAPVKAKDLEDYLCGTPVGKEQFAIMKREYDAQIKENARDRKEDRRVSGQFKRMFGQLN